MWQCICQEKTYNDHFEAAKNQSCQDAETRRFARSLKELKTLNDLNMKKKQKVVKSVGLMKLSVVPVVTHLLVQLLVLAICS